MTDRVYGPNEVVDLFAGYDFTPKTKASVRKRIAFYTVIDPVGRFKPMQLPYLRLDAYDRSIRTMAWIARIWFVMMSIDIIRGLWWEFWVAFVFFWIITPLLIDHGLKGREKAFEYYEEVKAEAKSLQDLFASLNAQLAAVGLPFDGSQKPPLPAPPAQPQP